MKKRLDGRGAFSGRASSRFFRVIFRAASQLTSKLKCTFKPSGRIGQHLPLIKGIKKQKVYLVISSDKGLLLE